MNFLVSKENDLDSNASSIDTDMEDSVAQDSDQYDSLTAVTPVTNSVMIVSRTVDDDLNNISLNENEDYTPNNLSHMHLLHPTVNTDPNLYRHNRTIVDNNRVSTDLDQYQHGQNLQYFTDTSNERLKLLKSKSIATPSPSNSSVGTNYDPNSDINFLYDLVTPPTTTRTIAQSVPPQPNNDDNSFFDDTWNE